MRPQGGERNGKQAGENGTAVDHVAPVGQDVTVPYAAGGIMDVMRRKVRGPLSDM